MNADRYYSADALAGAAGALGLPPIAAFAGVAAAFTTKKTRRTGAAAAFSGPVIGEDETMYVVLGRMNPPLISTVPQVAGVSYTAVASTDPSGWMKPKLIVTPGSTSTASDIATRVVSSQVPLSPQGGVAPM